MMRNIWMAGFVSFAVWGQAALAQPVVIAALGDSLTQGYGLPEEQGFVPQLEAELQRLGTESRVINAGVSGDTTKGGLNRVAWTLTPDVDAMIVALGGNDLLRGLDPAMSRANLRGILEAAKARDVQVLLIGMQAPGNYGPDYKLAFDQMYPELSEEFDVPLYPSFFAGFEGQGNVPAQFDGMMQPDGLHPSPEGVRAIVADLAPVVAAWLTESN